MIYFKVGKKRYEMPSAWQEVTVRTFERMAVFENDYSDKYGMLAALANIDKDELLNAKEHLGTMVTEGLRLLSDEQQLLDKIPHKAFFSYKGEAYKVPKDLEGELFGQKVELQTKLMNEEPAGLIAFAVALYMQPIIDKKFDEARVKVLAEEFRDLPIIDLYPLANFFFSELQKYKMLGKLGFDLLR